MNTEQKNNQPCFRTKVGGQALMEGIMMRGPKAMCMAVRRPDGTVFTETSAVRHHAWEKWPLVRGVCSFLSSLAAGYRCLMKSADIALEEEAQEEPSGFDKWVADKFGEKGTSFVMGAAAFSGVALAAVLFVLVPTGAAGLIDRFLPLGGWRSPVEGVFKLVILLGYMLLIGRMPEIHRLFCYHGAEHKTIACYEARRELTVENVRPCTRFHPRCGTSFLLIAVLLSILAGACITTGRLWLRVLLKFALLPVIMGVSYELIQFCGRHDTALTRAVAAPGLWLQRITTQEPDDGMIECAIAAILPVLPEHPEEASW